VIVISESNYFFKTSTIRRKLTSKDTAGNVLMMPKN